MSRKPKQQQKAFKNAYSSGFSNRKRNAKYKNKKKKQQKHEMAGKMKKGGNGNEKVDFQGCQGYLPAWSELLISRQSPVAFEEGQRLHREREREREK